VRIASSIQGGLSDLIADYSLTRNSGFIQDIWRPIDTLEILLGLRYDRYSQDPAPDLNPFFLGRYGIPNNATLAGRDVFSPRFNAQWRPLSRTTLRGGVGIFAANPPAGLPITWFNETYLADGISFANAEVTAAQLASSPPITGTTLPAALQTQLDTIQRNFQQANEGDVSALDPGFEIPRVLRAQAAITQDFDIPFLGKDWRFTVEYTWSDQLQGLQFIDLRLRQQVVNGVPVFLPDGTPRFVTNTVGDARPGVTPSTGANAFRTGQSRAALEQDILITNTQLGSSEAFRFELTKTWDFGRFGNLNFRGDYSRIRQIDVSPANDTATLVSVFETGNYSNINNPAPSEGIQSIPNNLVYEFTWNKTFWKNWEAQLNLVGNYRAGRATSLVSVNPASVPGGTGPTAIPAGIQLLQPGYSTSAFGRILAYLPDGPNDPNVRYINGASYNQLVPIINELGLSQFAGGIIPRNSIRGRDAHQLDLNGQIRIPLPKGRLILDGSIQNFLNLIDQDNGVISRFDIRETLYTGFFDPAGNGGQGQYVITGIDPGVPLFTIDEQVISQGSRWRANLGVRYQF